MSWRTGSKDGLVPNLVAINVGVEIGEVLALSAILVLMDHWRRTKYFRTMAYNANVAIMSAGFVLVGVQLAGYLLARPVT